MATFHVFSHLQISEYWQDLLNVDLNIDNSGAVQGHEMDMPMRTYQQILRYLYDFRSSI